MQQQTTSIVTNTEHYLLKFLFANLVTKNYYYFYSFDYL